MSASEASNNIDKLPQESGLVNNSPKIHWWYKKVLLLIKYTVYCLDVGTRERHNDNMSRNVSGCVKETGMRASNCNS